MKLERTYTFSPALFGLLPMLNVLVLVLVFYVMSSRFLLQPGVPVDLPVTAFTLGPQRNAYIVSLSAGPTAELYFKEKAVTLADFHKEIQAIKEPDRSLIIKADRKTQHDLVVQVMNLGLREGFNVMIASDIESPR
jgi:biopolymer transport protein ExbD